MLYQAKKIYHGYISVRDYIVKECLRRGEDLILEYKGKAKTIPYEDLRQPDKYQIHKIKFLSKYDRQYTYELYDFPFSTADK